MKNNLESLKVAVLPMTSIDDSRVNLSNIKKAIQKLDKDVRLLCLPENSLYMKLDKAPLAPEKAFTFESPEIQELQELAASRSLFIHMGGIPWKQDGKVYNESLFITDQGLAQTTYEKMHLFDVNLGPGLETCESASFSRGHRLSVIEVDGWRLASTICYDVRFAEIFLHYVENYGVDGFLVPAAFTTKTGELHWQILLQARAIETQAFVIAAAQVGTHKDPSRGLLRKSYGQSLIISPWGEILAETPNFKAFADSNLTEHDPVSTVLKRAEIDTYRRSIPVSQHRYYKMELVPR